ncbi:MAG: class I SAM-dependent methyltransferase [Vicinamibacterales bacterium]
MTATMPCQVCGGTAFADLYAVTDTNQDVPGCWTIAGCAACGLGRLSPMPTPDEIGGFYRDVFYAEDGRRFRPWMEDLRERLAGLRGRRLRRLMAPGRLLDYGAGAGHFVAALRRAGWDASGFEPFNTATGGTGAADTAGTRLACPDGHYDAITLWYVIEHLADPRGAIREFHRALRPGGLLVLSQQDFASVQARVFRGRWLFLDPPRHLFQFSPATLTRMAAEEGFRLKARSSASLEMGPFTILQSLLNVLTGNRNHLFRFLKSRRLAAQARGRDALGLVASLLLLPVLAPLSLALYFGLLAFGSGDVFTLYLERLPDERTPAR